MPSPGCRTGSARLRGPNTLSLCPQRQPHRSQAKTRRNPGPATLAWSFDWALGPLALVSTHLEPRGAPVHSAPTANATVAEVQALVRQAASEVSEIRNCHDVQVRTGHGGLYVSLHCLADADLPIAKAHLLASQVERRVVTRLPDVVQVLVHVEPEKRDA